MSVARLGPDGVAALAVALGEPAVVGRYAPKVVRAPGSECWWWTGAASGRGHGRIWLGSGRVAIAHRLAIATVHGVDALIRAEVLGHRCNNPLCQRIGPGHVVVSSHAENRREWAARRRLAGSPLGDMRGARGRSRALRDLARGDPLDITAELARLRHQHGQQLPLW